MQMGIDSFAAAYSDERILSEPTGPARSSTISSGPNTTDDMDRADSANQIHSSLSKACYERNDPLHPCYPPRNARGKPVVFGPNRRHG